MDVDFLRRVFNTLSFFYQRPVGWDGVLDGLQTLHFVDGTADWNEYRALCAPST